MFLSSFGAAGICALAFSVKARATEAAQAGASASTSLKPAARKSPAVKRASAAALALAASYRRFDPKLTGDDIGTIARGIDDNAKAAAALNPKKRRLRNSDEPVTVFRVRG